MKKFGSKVTVTSLQRSAKPWRRKASEGGIPSASAIMSMSALKERLNKERQELSERIVAIDKIMPLHEELAALNNPDYKEELVQEYADLKEDKDGKLVPVAEGELIPQGKPQLQYEFAEAYTNPERAVKILIELTQLDREAQGLPRLNIITMEQAWKIRNDKTPIIGRNVVSEQ